MTPLPDDPQHELTTERVRSGRRAALIVVVGAVVVVGTLIWKPWDTGSGAPAASPAASSGPIVALATPSPSPIELAPQPIGTPPPAIGPTAAVTPPPIGTLTWYKGGAGDPVVTCVYGAAAHGRRALNAMVVSGPSLTASADESANPLRAVAWRADIEVNDLQSVFSAEWRSATQSDVARYQMRPHDQFTAPPVTVSVAPDPGQEASAVYRAVVDVHWLGPGDADLHSQRTVATSYGPPADATEGCPAFVTRKR